MFGHRYYHETTRRYVAVFGTLFNDIVIDRKDNSGEVIQQMKVPISYGPKQKFLAKIEGDSDLDRASAITLPRMSFEITGLSYDGERKIQQTNRKKKANSGDNSKLYSQFAPSPYNLDFELTIMTKYAEDGTKILEQILPFFQPAWTAAMSIVDGMDETVDIPIILSNVTTEDVYEGDYETRRSLMWTLTFTLKGYYYGPISQKKIIKFTNVNMHSNLTATEHLSTVRLQPGLNANNEPVTSLTGFQATAVASIGQGLVTSIEIGSGGSNYRSPTVTIDAPLVTAATANTVTLTDTSVSDVGLITSGGGYYNIPPVVDFSSPTSPAITAELSVTMNNGSIDTVTVANSGLYYIGTESVLVQDPGSDVASYSDETSLFGDRSYHLSSEFADSVFSTSSNTEHGSISFSVFVPESFEVSPSDIATATATINGGSVDSLNVASSGARYTSQPTVIVSSPDTDTVGATASSVVTGDSVGFVSVTEPGNYYTTAPAVIISQPTANVAPETASVSLSFTDGKVSGATIVDGGELYISAPTILVDAPTASGQIATATAILTGDAVTSITIDTSGDGYASPPIVTISDSDTGVDATATAVISNGEVTSITIDTSGDGYTSPPTVTISDPLDDPESRKAVISATIQNGSVTSLSIDSPGIGYEVSANPTAVVEGPSGSITDFTATATAIVVDGVVSSIIVDSGGHYYDTAPIVTVEESTGNISDFAATATATVSSGLVTSLTITNSGRFYDVAPDVFITAPPHAGLLESNDLTVFVDPDRQIGIYDATSGLETTIPGDVSNSWTHVSVQTPADSSNTHLTINNSDLGTLTSVIETTPTLIFDTDSGVKLVNSHNTGAYIDEVVVKTNVATYDGVIPTAAHVSDANTVLYVDFETLQSTEQGEISLTVVDGVVTGATIVNAGAGYSFTPTVTVDAPDGTQATFTAFGTGSILNGEVTGVSINYGGLGYITRPTVTIRPPTAITATASAITDANENIESIVLTNLGSGYTSTPNVTISSPDNLSIPYEQINFDDPWDYIITIEDP